MRILYVAKHDSGGNDDEGAITHALRVLGHEVECIQETHGYKACDMRGDLLLFHKWDDVQSLRRVQCKKVFYYFDLVDYMDSAIVARNAQRIAWMGRIMPFVDRGFCTDGDWAARHPDKLTWLAQGADERIVGRSTQTLFTTSPILFTGISRNGGHGRREFVELMKKTYEKDFAHYETGLYREELAKEIHNTKIVVAPNAPVTNRYWSNRVYNALGFGAFMLHPRCRRLESHYEHSIEIVYYDSLEELVDLLIPWYVVKPHIRRRIAEAGLKRTQSEHLYRHRMTTLLEIACV